MSLSIVIPTYNAVEYLDICLMSIEKNQVDKDNEIIIVVDGTYSLNKDVISAYEQRLNIKLVVFDENRGLALSTNYGFYNATNKYVLTINDDNVVCPEFDVHILNYSEASLERKVIIPNQIEPRPSIFPQFIIKNLGDTFDSFDFESFNKFSNELFDKNAQKIKNEGGTFPFCIEKDIFLSVGGFDPFYGSPHVIDWEFFYKLQKLGIPCYRDYAINFYHFGSKTARTPESYTKEQMAHDFFKYKWGGYLTNQENNFKAII